MKIYLDACCLSRLTDDQTQPSVRAEAEAVEHILGIVRQGQAFWISSTVLKTEVNRNPDPARRREAAALLSFANEIVTATAADADRAKQIEEEGFTPFDALHLACAERGGADLFLTTDHGLLRRALRNPGRLHVRVENPVSWFQEQRS